MRRITAWLLGIPLAGLLAGTPAAGTSVEDERTEAMIATIAAADPGADLIAPPSPRPVAAPDDGGIVIDDPAAPGSDRTGGLASTLLHGNVLYGLNALPAPHLDAKAPLDGIASFAQHLVIGLEAVDLGNVAYSN
jgi:hypothetical protein